MIRFYGDKEKADAVYKGVEPLGPEDIAEMIVFATSRRENVVLADFTIFPNHQVSLLQSNHLRILWYSHVSFIHQASATVMHRKS